MTSPSRRRRDARERCVLLSAADCLHNDKAHLDERPCDAWFVLARSDAGMFLAHRRAEEWARSAAYAWSRGPR